MQFRDMCSGEEWSICSSSRDFYQRSSRCRVLLDWFSTFSRIRQQSSGNHLKSSEIRCLSMGYNNSRICSAPGNRYQQSSKCQKFHRWKQQRYANSCLVDNIVAVKYAKNRSILFVIITMFPDKYCIKWLIICLPIAIICRYFLVCSVFRIFLQTISYG